MVVVVVVVVVVAVVGEHVVVEVLVVTIHNIILPPQHLPSQPHSHFYDAPKSFATSAQRICYGNWIFWRHRQAFDIVNRKSARNAVLR